jgi:predicted metal-dependent phosphoesterase TrpH
MSGSIDLHSHTDESDGSLKPAELIALAKHIGLQALAITDHDTFAGFEKAKPLTADGPLQLVQGIELNSRLYAKNDGHMRHAHILAYFPLVAPNTGFLEWLQEAQAERRDRNAKLVASLQNAGVDITLAEVESKGRSLAGRPHFARILVDKGYARTLEDAFRRYLGEEAPSYVHRDSKTTEETVALIRQGGGIPVIAHPIRIGLDEKDERQVFARCKDAGLLGLEVYHSEHSPDRQTYYLQLARELGLAPTGGSDFHGITVKPDIDLGSGRGGNVRVPFDFLTGLRDLASRLA